MTSRIYTVTVDCADPARLAEFWAEALGYATAYVDDDEVAVEPPDEAGPALLFIRVPDEKVTKNRIHLDLNPDDQEAEVQRLRALGAETVDIGQVETTWVVMADPEGNEFCVLTARD